MGLQQQRERRVAEELIKAEMTKDAYTAMAIKTRKQMAVLVDEHVGLTGSSAPYIMYRSKLYTSPFNATVPMGYKNKHKSIHFSLIQRAESILEITFDQKVMISKINMLISKAVKFSTCSKTLRSVLDLHFTDLVPYNIGPPLSDDEVNQFKQKHSGAYDALGTLTIYNLIVGD